MPDRDSSFSPVNDRFKEREDDKSEYLVGVVDRINKHGFGFLRPKEGEGEDVFFHTHEIEGADIRQLRAGDEVKYQKALSQKVKNQYAATKVIPDPEVSRRPFDRTLERNRSGARRRSRSRSRRRRSSSWSRGRRSRSPRHRRSRRDHSRSRSRSRDRRSRYEY